MLFFSLVNFFRAVYSIWNMRVMPDSGKLTEIENAKYLVTIEEALLNIEIIVAVQSSLLFFAYVPQLIFRLSVLIM